ncbi:MAG TPA: YcfL family protein [Phycisphaerae bacterium]|jgi:uncharacterized protein YcfL|nr:YcfL family protein [Phycisphaerae bacterium]
MKRIVAPLLLAAVALGFAGCTEKIGAYQDPEAPKQVMITEYWLRQQIRVNVPRPERVGAGQLKVNMNVYNTTDHDLLIQYKYIFTDKNGVQVDNIGAGWESERIAPRDTHPISFTSMSAAADDFQVTIRPAK